MNQAELSELYGAIRLLLRSDHKITLRAASSRVRIDRHYIELACRIHGATFRQLRTAALRELALRLLAEQRSQSIKAIAIDLGFSSSSAFCRFMRKTTGRTPTEWREAL